MSAKQRQSITELAMQPRVILPRLQEKLPGLATQKNLLTAVLAALDCVPEMHRVLASPRNMATGFQGP